MFNLEFFKCLEKHVFPSWAQFLWAEGAHGWASPGHIPGHREGLLGLVTSMGSSLDAGHSP